MSKKRTKPQRNTKSKSKSKSRRHTTGTLKKWNTVEDIPMDAEDEFHAARDKILFEHEQNGGYHSDDGDEDEVFALKGVQEDSENEEEPDDQEYYEIEEEEQAPSRKTKKENKSKKVNGKLKTQNKSDEEDDDADESWGQGKYAYYSSNADQLDSDDEEGHELEEQEATRLQMKSRQELRDEDFGLNDELEFEKRPEVDDILDSLPEAIPLSMDKQSLLRHLEKTNPESLALAKDWDDVAHQLHRTRLKIEKLEEEKAEPLGLGMIHLYYQTLLSYSTVLAFYLHMRASAKYAQRPALLQSHPIMERLLTLKQGLQILEDLDFAATETEDDGDDYMDMDDILADGEQVWRLSEAGALEPHELDDLLQDAERRVLPEPKAQKPPKKKRKVVVSDTNEIPTNPIFDLVEPEFVSSNSLSSHRHNINRASEDLLDDYGDPMSLTAVDAVDKSARRKKLRFHTSKIESASSRRKDARTQMVGGDDDIPYRERKKDRDTRLVKEAAKRAGNERGEDLTLDGGEEEGEEKHRVGEKRTRLDDEEDDYYELVKKKSKEAKERQKAEYDEAHGLPRVPIEEESSGPRSLTRAILKNKGLTPQRPKAVRNPRVKKRQRFEKAKRRVSSQKAVFRGGLSETKGRYEGEKSGISKVVKSVRLG